MKEALNKKIGVHKQSGGGLGKSLILSFVLVLIFLIGGELAFREGAFAKSLPLRSHGLANIQFDIKWFKLQEYLKDHEGVDVVFTGSSLVNTGIDPDIIQSLVLQYTGQKVGFFNYGTEGLSLPATLATVEILIDTAHPDVIVLASEMRDYYTESGQELANNYVSSPWVRQRLGYSNFSGWLSDNSVLLQKAYVLRDWMQEDFPETHQLSVRRWHDTSPSGYEPDNHVMYDIEEPIDLSDPQIKAEYDALYGFSVAEERLQALQNIVALCKNTGVQLILLDMPAHPTFFGFFGGETEHAKYLDFIQNFAFENDLILIPAMPYENVPLEGWSDRIHLNRDGVPVFSAYLGSVFNALIDSGQLNPGISGANR